MSDFIFPFRFDDLLEETTDTRYYVQSKDNVDGVDERRVEERLENIERDLNDSWAKIREPKNFDTLYYFIKCLEPGKENFSPRLIQFVPEILVQAMGKLLKEIGTNVARDYREPEFMENMRNAFKMYLFLFIYYMNNTHIKKAKLTLNDQIQEMSQLNNKKPKKKRGKDINKDNQTVIIEKQSQILSTIRKCISVNLRYVWGKQSIDEEFYKYLLDICLKMLESKNLLKDTKTGKDDIFSILEHTLSEHEASQKNVEIKLINLIYEEESLVDPIADFIVKASKSVNTIISKLATNFLNVLVTYLLEKTNVSAESQAIKNTKELLTKISLQVPKLFYVNLSTFVTLYESESYLLRNALSDIIGEIVRRVLTAKDGEDDDLDSVESKIKAKTRLLDKLVRRINDKHAFARAHVFKVFIDLCGANVVPKEYLQVLLGSACERIKDVSANVRKRAIELINTLVKMYYGIFVDNKEKGFISKDDLEREKKYTLSEIAETEKKIKEIREDMKKLDEDSEDYNELADDLKIYTGKWSSQDSTRRHIDEYITLLTQLEQTIPYLIQLLGSKNQNDVIETIRLLFSLKSYKFPLADLGIRKMLVLIWSKERATIEELLNCYWQLYFDTELYSSERVAGNLIHLYNRSNLTERTSLEEVIAYVLTPPQDEKDKKIKDIFYFPDPVFKILWNIFLVGFQNMEKVNFEEEVEQKHKEEKQSVRSALEILRVVYSKKKDILDDKLESFNIILKSFIKNHNPDWIFCKEIASILEISKESSPRTTAIIKNLILLVIKWHGTTDSEWYCAAEALINLVFSIKSNPEALIQYLLLHCTRFLVGDKKASSQFLTPGKQDNLAYPHSPVPGSPMRQSQSSKKIDEELDKPDLHPKVEQNFEEKLSQLFFLVGQASVRLLIHFDNIENYFKRLKNEAETKAQQGRKNMKDEELDKISGGMEADIDRKIGQLTKISEKFVVQKNLLGFYVPLMKSIVMEIINKKGSVRNPMVERSCVLALCKYMTVSSEFCEKNMNLIFGLLRCKIDAVTKTNIIISIGDLIHRFPIITEPYTQNLYQNLQDESAAVRKTTLMVITHLILNDMLKLRGEISDIALLFDDPEHKIQGLVKLFFHELHKKDSKAIYNLLPEAIGRLSRMPTVNETVFQNFARNVMQYLEKEKYSETLVDKLTSRIANSDNEKDWRNSAYCLSLLQYNEKSIRKLVDNFEFYREKLADDEINEYFKNLLTKFKKMGRAETKILVDEFESKLTNYMKEGVEPKRKVPEKKKKGKGRGAASQKETQEMAAEEKKTGEQDDEIQDEEEKPKKGSKRQIKKLKKPAASQKASKPTLAASRPKRKGKAQKIVEEEDSDEEDEEEISEEEWE